MSRLLFILLFVPLLANSSGMGMAAAVLAAQGGVPQTGLVLYLPFDANADDQGPNNFTATFVGDAFVSDGVLHGDGSGDAIHFGANLDSVVVGDSAQFTMLAWVTWVNGSYQNYFCKYDTSPNARQFFFRKNENNTLSFFWFGQLSASLNYREIRTSNTYTSTGWHHLAVSFDATQSVWSDKTKIYVDGVEVSTFGAAGNATGNIPAGGLAPFAIGDNVQTDGSSVFGPGFSFDGEMDDVLVYDRILTAAEISRIYNLRSDPHP